MTTIDTHAETAVAATGTPTGTSRGLAAVASWITTADHKRIGRLFIGFSLTFTLALGVVGGLLGLERIDTTDDLLNIEALGQLFSLFRVGMVFFVAIPLLLGAAIAVVPLQIGARSLAFPRAAAAGLWTWLTGSGIVIAAYAMNGGPGGGDENAVDLFLAGLALSVIGLIVAATTVATTVLTSRAPGMRTFRTPSFAWSAFVTSVALLATLPILVGTLIYLFADHRFGTRLPIEQNGWGGNAGINSWIKFAFTQPQTFVYAIPVLGLVAECVPVFAKRRMALRLVALTGMGIMATASLSGITQTTHDVGAWDTLGSWERFEDLAAYAFFNLLPIVGVLVVMGAATFTLLPALKAKTLRLSAPLAFALGGAGMVALGMVAHAFSPIVDLQLAGTVYEEAEFTFITYGIVLGGMGAVSYWGPKLWGRKLPFMPTFLMALGGTGAVVLVSVPYIISGFHNQPGLSSGGDATSLVKGWDHEAAPGLLNALVTAGHALFVLTVLGFALLAVRCFTAGERAGDDPWDGFTLEWATSSPPPRDNFVDLPTVSSAEPLADLKPSGSHA